MAEGRTRRLDMVLLVGSAAAAMVMMTIASDSLRVFLDGFRLWIQDRWETLTSWF